MTVDEKIPSNGLGVYKEALVAVAKQRSEVEAKLISMTRLCAYYFTRYNDTRSKLARVGFNKIGLESMVAALQERLGDKGLDIKLGDDLDVV